MVILNRSQKLTWVIWLPVSQSTKETRDQIMIICILAHLEFYQNMIPKIAFSIFDMWCTQVLKQCLIYLQSAGKDQEIKSSRGQGTSQHCKGIGEGSWSLWEDHIPQRFRERLGHVVGRILFLSKCFTAYPQIFWLESTYLCLNLWHFGQST